MINIMAAGLTFIGLLAVAMAYLFGKRYQTAGNKSHKYLCVCFCVASCVCIITAIQFMFLFPSV